MIDNRLQYYSENWVEATEKFVQAASKYGVVKQYCRNNHKYPISVVRIGNGANKIVINSGVHGIEGYFGSAAQLMFLNDIANKLTPTILNNYTFVLIHIINGWGMQHRMREVMLQDNKGLVDLNRNFGIDFNNKNSIPNNEKYKLTHDILVNTPGGPDKQKRLVSFYKSNKDNGVWDSIKNGQYYEPFGLFYGGNATTIETQITLDIYDDLMKNAKSLISIGLHTGLGRFYRKRAYTTANLLVSHPLLHPNTQKFVNIMTKGIKILPDEQAINGPVLKGDMVDCIENRYKYLNIPIYTADFEIGTGEWPVLSPILKKMDMGDGRYDLIHYGKINSETLCNLTESWYPSDDGWKLSALKHAYKLFINLLNYSQNTK